MLLMYEATTHLYTDLKIKEKNSEKEVEKSSKNHKQECSYHSHSQNTSAIHKIVKDHIHLFSCW